MKTRSLTPVKLRLILSLMFVLTLILASGVFYLAYRHLGGMAADVAGKVAQANKSRDTIQELQKLKQELESNQDVIDKVTRVAADGQDYAYQNQIVNDLFAYAKRSGMVIGNITFSSGGGAAATPTPPGDPAAAGQKKATVTVTLKNPADYRGLLNFLYSIEHNLTRLNIATVTLSKSTDGMVNTEMLSLEVYLR